MAYTQKSYWLQNWVPVERIYRPSLPTISAQQPKDLTRALFYLKKFRDDITQSRAEHKELSEIIAKLEE